ncbi:MAG: hypothetical protein H7Y27_06555 [Gemmatimonadaceae bacterium]|nr:hypothetical protein [Chitinophagaceae bacterium]
MRIFRTRFLLLSSLLLMLAGCSSAYRHLRPAEANPECLNAFKPDFTRALYNTKVNVIGKHLSGLLLIKLMPDSSHRMLFSNEFGFKFFDFEFAKDGSFKVHYILKDMDKPAVIKTLRKDFELLLMTGTNKPGRILTDGTNLYYAFRQPKGYNYYITDSSCQKLLRIEKASKRKAVVVAIMEGYEKQLPDTIGISHKTFNFEIGLKRIKQ